MDRPMQIEITGYIREVGDFATMIGKGKAARGVVLETADGDVTMTGLRKDIVQSFATRLGKQVTLLATTLPDSGDTKHE